MSRVLLAVAQKRVYVWIGNTFPPAEGTARDAFPAPGLTCGAPFCGAGLDICCGALMAGRGFLFVRKDILNLSSDIFAVKRAFIRGLTGEVVVSLSAVGALGQRQSTPD